ncbi:MAG: iron transporter [Acidimicrobiales bacterium mtb01]|nr:iron transporter [Actinomycetota bacterium]TEX45793.1 MAG: iron transporter [Acidimicrobiales bacterium mtb01]
MGASFLITLREGLEVSLVLAILVAYLVKTGRGSETGAVWKGTGLAMVLCLAVGLIIHAAIGELHGTANKIVEGSIAVAAAGVLTWMIFWMRANARSLGSELRSKVDAATGAAALGVIAFVATVREGLETVLFLLSAETGSSSGSQVVLGGILGLVVATILGVAIYRGGNRLNLRRFFQVTGVLLILFAAGLVGKAFHEFREAMGLETGLLIDPVWTVESGLWAKGTFYDFMKGFFGWHARTELIRLIAYIAYLVPVMYLFLRPAKVANTSSASRPTSNDKEPAPVG